MSRKRAIDARESHDPKFIHWKSRFKAATVAFEMGKLDEARTVIYRSLMEAESLKDKNFAVPVCHIGMAVVSMNQEKEREAKDYFEKAINALSGQPEADTRELYGAALRFYAHFYERKNDLSEAENCLRQSIAVLRELGPESAAQLAYSLADLAAIMVRTGQLEEADVLVKSAIEILVATVGTDDPSYDWAKLIYQVCLNQNDREMLELVFEDSVTAMQYKLGARHPNLVRALNAYGTALRKRGLTEKLEHLKEKFSALV